MMAFDRTDEPVDAQNATIETGAVFEEQVTGQIPPITLFVHEVSDGEVRYTVGGDEKVADIETFENTIMSFQYQRVDADAGEDDEDGPQMLLTTHDVRGELRDHGVVGASVTNNRVGDAGEKDYVVKIGVYADYEAVEIERVVEKSDMLEWYSDEWDHRENTGTYGRYVVGEVEA